MGTIKRKAVVTMNAAEYHGRVAPSIGPNQPNWSWDAELTCIEQGFRVFKQQENEDMGMGPLFDVAYEIYIQEHS